MRSPARVRNELVAEVVDVLQESATVRHGSSAELWVGMLSQELDRPVEPRGEALRPWLLQLVESCAQLPDGLSCLVRCLGYVEQQSTAISSLRRLVDEWDAVDFFDGADLHPLRPILRETRSSAGLAALARRASRSRIQELPAWCDNGWAVFLRLAGENSAAKELPVSMAFLALVADRLMEDGQAEASEQLRHWNRRQARTWGLEDKMADWQRSGVVEVPPLHVPAYLMIQFEPDGVDPERYYLSHWRQSDAEGWHPVPGETLHLHRDELPGEVELLIEQTEERWADLRQPVVLEFILPWELLGEPVEWWHKESSSSSPTPLVMDYAVLVRSFERLRKAAWHRHWHNKWRRLKEQPADSHSYWNRPGQSHFHLERELKEDEHAVCLVLSQPPGTDSPAARQEYMAGLRAGVPAMIWHRGDCADDAFREAVADIVQDRGLAGLMERTGKWRREALATGPEGWDNHVGRHLAILLDDPERRPGPAGPDRTPTEPDHTLAESDRAPSEPDRASVKP
ncbi:VMAP-C domain-containing protein [Streptomyces phaeochromogenes]|uniref:VMAP-C domain-containing protein n=1 Tax=Streptomyces phaeochromogenes TaxID=1923 RepID=UPI0036899A30